MADEQVKNEAAAPEAASATPATPTPPAGRPAPSGGYRRGPGGDRGPRPGGSPRDGGRKFFRRKKVCKFCVEKIDGINYKDVSLIRGFVAERGRIIPRRISGVCTPHQRQLAEAIKKARNIALLPFAAEI